MSPRKARSPLELAGNIGAAAFDLYHHGDGAARGALCLLWTVNPEVMEWLRDRLVESTTPAKSREEASTEQGPVTPSASAAK